MNDKLVKRIRETEDEVAGEIVEARSQGNRDVARMRAMFVLGGVTVARKVASSLNSNAITTLIRFQEDKMHEDLGYATFVEFLNESEFAPLTKTQFYEGKALLEKEGEEVFDLLTELGISIRKRKLLGKGNVELAGDMLIVHDGDEVTEIPITDRSSIFDAITALADANAEKSIKLERQKEKIDKHDERVRELNDDFDRLKASKISEIASTPHMTARVELAIAFRRMTEAAADLSAIEKDQFRDQVLEDLAGWRLDLAAAYNTASPKSDKAVEITGDFGADLETFLDGVDLDAEDNDSELAAIL